MPFVITPIQNNSDCQQKDDIEFSPRADSGIHSPASSMQQSPRSQNSSPYENRALFPLPEFQSQNVHVTPMPRQPHDLPDPIRDSQPSNSNTPQNSTSATDRGKIALSRQKSKKNIKEMILTAHSESKKERETTTKTIYYKYLQNIQSFVIYFNKAASFSEEV